MELALDSKKPLSASSCRREASGPDYTREELRSFVSAAYGKQFDTPQIAPLQPVRPGTYALELWHGPTCAFKDFALQLLPHLLKAAAEKCGDHTGK